MEWMEQAACVGEDPELFFPVGTTGPSVRETQAAKEVCRRCPVTETCLDWALRMGQTTGVWGGTSEAERAPMLRALRRRRVGARSR
ncbi:WhiB family transcriptional regulator [Streptomyces indicus]|uniref:Transcriptional regulator WhiB n=1 Tax=Streptomyces indicus TaxID=417292 RepID=A0A1G8TT45_9ACTN|nr:WhiB family transcriptional regulator [Streptomyces indicus]SDJ44597.1 WhiB family transcriptional regulator, redox-sensing transcriptional regulator [Streptomyces indicus]